MHEAVLEVGSSLKDAEATVHAVTAVPAPNTPSPYDIKEDDEQYCEEIDGQPWDDEEANYYSIEVDDHASRSRDKLGPDRAGHGARRLRTG